MANDRLEPKIEFNEKKTAALNLNFLHNFDLVCFEADHDDDYDVIIWAQIQF